MVRARRRGDRVHPELPVHIERLHGQHIGLEKRAADVIPANAELTLIGIGRVNLPDLTAELVVMGGRDYADNRLRRALANIVGLNRVRPDVAPSESPPVFREAPP